MEFYAYPKINICLKITGFLPNNYCKLASRFIRIKNICDILEICKSDSFKISGNFSCAMQENTIFKAKETLKAFLKSRKINSKSLESFSIEVEKKIPPFAGLGGGSSDAASYLLAMNEILELHLSQKDLMQIASQVGADVSFFVCDCNSANVFGSGEKVEKFSESLVDFEILTPPIKCSTKAVYDEFRAMIKRREVAFFTQGLELLAQDSTTLLSENAINFLNDLYAPAIKIYPSLCQYAKEGYFFSGSGSSFFRLKDWAICTK